MVRGNRVILLSLTLLARRLIFPRVLELSEDSILYPRGFRRTRIIRIDYADIIRMSEERISGHNRLYLATGKGYFKIISSRLPDKETYFVWPQAILELEL